jgi:hypothetical protein
VNISSLVVIPCILNEFRDHKLLNDALNVITSITLKLKKEMNHFLLLDALIDDDSGLNIELETLRRFSRLLTIPFFLKEYMRKELIIC